jgi:hypothetical protein
MMPMLDPLYHRGRCLWPDFPSAQPKVPAILNGKIICFEGVPSGRIEHAHPLISPRAARCDYGPGLPLAHEQGGAVGPILDSTIFGFDSYAGYYGPLPYAWDKCFDRIDYGSCQIRIHSGHPDTISVPRLSQDAQLAAYHRFDR